MNLVNILLALLIVGASIFGLVFFKDYRAVKIKGELEVEGSPITISLMGFFICFFDTLGIGGFAPMTATFKHFRLVKDRIIPGTLNTAMCIPIIAEALIFIKEVSVDMTTLISMVIAAILGATVGAGIVAKMEEKKVQMGMAAALGVILITMFAEKMGALPSGGEAISLGGMKLVIAIIGNFVLGALMSIGIGLYAPCLALVCALGVSPLAAFPIMMGSCAFLMPFAGIRFIRKGAYNRRCTLIVTISGVCGVIMAAYIVKSLPLNILTWLIMGIISYTVVRLFLSSRSSRDKANEPFAKV